MTHFHTTWWGYVIGAYNYYSWIRITKGNCLLFEKKVDINKIIDVDDTGLVGGKLLAGICQVIIDCLIFITMICSCLRRIVQFCWMVNNNFIIHCAVHKLELHENIGGIGLIWSKRKYYMASLYVKCHCPTRPLYSNHLEFI